MPHPAVRIPKPCPVGQQALTPTEAGWHCTRCRTEIIDFTRLSEAEVLAYLAARPGQRVCATIQMPLVPPHLKRPKGMRRWLLLVAALLGGTRLAAWAGLPPVPLAATRLLPSRWAVDERIIVRGTVLDDSLNVPVRGSYVFISGTRYGAITDERGEFVLSLPAGWEPISHGEVLLDVKGRQFALQGQLVAVKIADNPMPALLTVRLLSVPQRGHIKGKAFIDAPPVAPPGAGRN